MDPIPSVRAPSPARLYPAITACICEDRPPTRAEIRIVAARLWREGLRFSLGAQSFSEAFKARRILLRAAKAALNGRKDPVV